MVRPKDCEQLSDEQIEQLEAVARATGKPGLLSEICARGAGDTKALEAAGVRFKADVGQSLATGKKVVPVARRKEPTSPLESVIQAAGAARTQEKAEAVPVDTARWGQARKQADALRGGQGIIDGVVKQAAKANQAEPTELSPKNEAVAQVVVKNLGPQVAALQKVIEALGGIEGIEERLDQLEGKKASASISDRLDVIEGKKSPPPGFLGGGNGKAKAGAPFRWNRIADHFAGRTQ